jgi:hypothetical protein
MEEDNSPSCSFLFHPLHLLFCLLLGRSKDKHNFQQKPKILLIVSDLVLKICFKHGADKRGGGAEEEEEEEEVH